MKWLSEDLGLLSSPGEAGSVAACADPEDTTYLVPAFTGLGAPYWKNSAKAMLYGMTRRTGRAEIVKAAEECIAYQVADLISVMRRDAGLPITELHVDGGPTRDRYLMQFQSDILGIPLLVPDAEELSALGAGYMAGMKLGMYDGDVMKRMPCMRYEPRMPEEERKRRVDGWNEAVQMLKGKE